jgi:hypothetical protein
MHHSSLYIWHSMQLMAVPDCRRTTTGTHTGVARHLSKTGWQSPALTHTPVTTGGMGSRVTLAMPLLGFVEKATDFASWVDRHGHG